MNFGGGGFMPGSQGGGSQGGGKKQSKHTHRPVTIRQIQDAYQAHPDSEFRIDDVEVEHLTFVGCVQNMTTSATNASLSIEDGTGSIDVRLWMETADDDGGKLAGIAQGVYVRVIGQLKSFNNKRSINAQVLYQITNHNEVQYHMLEAIYVHLYHTRGPPPEKQGAGAGPSAMQGVQRQQQPRTGNDPYQNKAQATTSSRYSDLKPLARKIMTYIERIGADNLPSDGVALDSIARGIGSSLEEVQTEVDDLLGEGQLYTTSDSDHVLPIEP